MKMEVDTSKLMKAIKLHRQIRKNRTYSYITNKAIQNVIGHAFAPTPKANPDRIAWIMGQVGTQVAYVDKKGRYKRYKKPRRIYQWEGSFASRIINKRRKDQGKPLLFGAEMEEAAKRMVGARLRSVAFITSGWIPPFEIFSKLVGRIPRYKKQGRVVGAPKGGATPAPKGTEVAIATAFNNANGAGKIGFAALQASAEYVARDMLQWATEQLRKAAREAGFKVK